MSALYRLGGLTFRSPIPLPVTRLATSERVDVDIALLAALLVPASRPNGRLVQEVDFGGWRVSLSQREQDFYLRYWGKLEAVYTADATRIALRRAPDFPAGMLEVMLAASILAPVFNLRGYTPLHASGVVVNERLIAIVAPSGGGKTSVAAALMAAGASLCTDDFMPLAESGGQLLTHPCSQSLRLRRGSIGEDFLPAGAATTITADERIQWQPGRLCSQQPLPIHSLLLPRFVDDQTLPLLSRLAPKEALLALLEHGKRSLGVQDPLWRRRDLERLSRLVQSSPAFHLNLRPGQLRPQALMAAVQQLSRGAPL